MVNRDNIIIFLKNKNFRCWELTKNISKNKNFLQQFAHKKMQIISFNLISIPKMPVWCNVFCDVLK